MSSPSESAAPAHAPEHWLAHVLALVVAVSGPSLLGLATSAVGEGSVVGALVLWGEPLLLLVGVHLVLALLWDHRWGLALATLAGFGLGGLALRRPAVPEPVYDLEPEWAARMQACARHPVERRAPLRVMSWTLDPASPLPELSSVSGQSADIYVLHGLAQPALAEGLAAQLQGEALFLPAGATDHGLALVVRGAFQRCGGAEDSWSQALGPPGAGGRAVLTFPEVKGVGVVPLVAARLPRPEGELGVAGWPAEVQTGARSLAALARALGAGRVVVVGDFGVPRTFRKAAGALLGAGLREADAPPNWPHRIGSLPGLPLHALERLWVGDEWDVPQVQAVDLGDQARRPLVAELVPRVGRVER